MTTQEELRGLCQNDDGSIRPKPDCRALMINKLILEDMMDIDDAENLIDKSLREWNLWNEPRIEDLLAEDENQGETVDIGN